jgi:hypothetical protein
MRKQGIAMAALAAALMAAGCDRGNDGKPTGPVDPIPGPTGAVAPNGNIVPQSGAPAAAAPGPGGTTAAGGAAAESKMPPEGSGSGKSVQEATAHGATHTEEKAAKQQR